MKRMLDAAIVILLFAAITQPALASVTLPEVAPTAGLLGLGVAALVAVRSFLRK